jgi:hypothetical protein
LIKASVSGPATARTRTTLLLDEFALGVLGLFEHAVTSMATAGTMASTRAPIPNLMCFSSS